MDDLAIELVFFILVFSTFIYSLINRTSLLMITLSFSAIIFLGYCIRKKNKRNQKRKSLWKKLEYNTITKEE